MRLSMAFGALSVAAGLLVACGDDGGTPRPIGGSGSGGSGGASGGRGGTGGTGNAGTGGTSNAGTGGTSNAGTGGTSNAGTGGTSNAGTGGTSGGDEPDAGDGDAATGDAGNAPCTGCVELRATFASGDPPSFFFVEFASTDMDTNSTVTFHLRGLTLDDQVAASPYANDGSGSTFGAGPFTVLSAAAGFDTEGEFVPVVFTVSSVSGGGFNNSDVVRVGLQVQYQGGIGAEATHTVSVLVDKIEFNVDGVAQPTLEFTNDAEGFSLDTGAGTQTAEVIHH
jgi:hypothetical protein